MRLQPVVSLAKKCSFVVRVSEGNFFFNAESEPETREWLGSINRSISVAAANQFVAKDIGGVHSKILAAGASKETLIVSSGDDANEFDGDVDISVGNSGNGASSPVCIRLIDNEQNDD